MIHKIKALHDGGNGLSMRAISVQLGISRNTVRKYLKLDELTVAQRQDNPDRSKRLDDCRDYIIDLLQNYPLLSAVKVLRKLRGQYPGLSASDRTVRRYLQALKQTVTIKQLRYYEPVLDMMPGIQCQVDPGELRGVMINGVERTIHFVVFVLSFSRLMFVALSHRAIDTQRFIQMHDEAFRYFGGCPKECVYDQTKLVVLHEEYRELDINPRFLQYATGARFKIKACEGYDPESKGKVEAGVKYVKGNCLYGETFENDQALDEHVIEWLNTVANVRIHATTGKQPQALFDEQERVLMQAYLAPACVHLDGQQQLTRKADKTGLISWQANKYSVPMVYQRVQVGVAVEDGELVIADAMTGEEIARHCVSTGKGQILKNNHHYRDLSQTIARHESDLLATLGAELGKRLCRCLQVAFPDNYKDQLVGLKSILKKHQPLNLDLLEVLSQRSSVSARQVRTFLEAYQDNPDRLLETEDHANCSDDITQALTAYGNLPTNEGGYCHEHA
jgi:transposase